MYCPNCGSNNQSDLKFCTRCGTNLGVVSDALSGKAGSAPIDDRMGKIIKEYYKGRRDTITGVVLIPAALKLIALMLLLGMKPVSSFFIVSWMVFWGIAALAGGLGKWIGAAGEMKALGHEIPKGRLHLRAERLLSRPGSGKYDSYSTGPVSTPISTPLLVPVGVTEQTTRTLEDKTRSPKQTQ